jgi:hypothetical protein
MMWHMATCQNPAAFPYGEALNNILRKIGFIDVIALPQDIWVATIYSASKTNTEKYSAQT